MAFGRNGALLCLTISVFLCFHSGECKLDILDIKLENQWTYLSKFCFSTGTGIIKSEAFRGWEYLHRPKGWSMLLYLDEQWDEVNAEPSCKKRKSMARATWEFDTPWRQVNVTQSIRPHYWFVAVANCDQPTLRPFWATLKLTFLNPGGDHFSYDEQGMVVVYALALVAYAIALEGCARRALQLYRGPQSGVMGVLGGMPGPVVLIGAAIALQFATVALKLAHLVAFSANGRGLPVLSLLSQVAEMVSQVVFAALLLLMASGWTIAVKAVPRREVALASAAALALVHVALVAAARSFETAHAQFHPSETVPGLVIVVLRAALLAIFVVLIRRSHGKEPSANKRELYLRTALLGCAWLVVLPLLVGVAALFAPYLRTKVVTGGILLAQSAIIASMSRLYLTRGTFFRSSTLSADLLPASHLS